MILLASLALVAATFAEEIEIPEDIDEDELGGFTGICICKKENFVEIHKISFDLFLTQFCF